jgi:hypothetical protein
MDQIVMAKDRLPQIPTIRITTAASIAATLAIRPSISREVIDPQCGTADRGRHRQAAGVGRRALIKRN